MPSSYTDSLRLEEQGLGENNNTWGTKLNTTIDLIDKSIAGHVAVAVTSGTTTLTSVNNAEDQARYKIIEVTGTLSGNVVIQVPAVSKEYIVWNSATVGAFSVTFRLGSAGDTVVIPATSARAFGITTDGSEWRPVSPSEATTSAMGIVELATDAEAQAQSATDKVLTPGNLGSVTATETRKGIVELATDAEAQTGTDTARAITAANLQAVTATETRKGVVELATDAEVQTGTDTARAITPAGLSARTATETRTGVVEIATDAEASTGTATNKALVPSNLSAATSALSTATTTAKGTVELATQTEVNTGTDTARAVVPSTLKSYVDTRTGTTSNLSLAPSVRSGLFNPASPTLAWTGTLSTGVGMSALSASTQGPGFFALVDDSGYAYLIYVISLSLDSSGGASFFTGGFAREASFRDTDDTFHIYEYNSDTGAFVSDVTITSIYRI